MPRGVANIDQSCSGANQSVSGGYLDIAAVGRKSSSAASDPNQAIIPNPTAVRSNQAATRQNQAAVRRNVPVVNLYRPIVHPNAPVVHSNAPGVNLNRPIVHPDAPVVNSNAPGVNLNQPIVQPNAPVVNSNIPGVNANPQAGEVFREIEELRQRLIDLNPVFENQNAAFEAGFRRGQQAHRHNPPGRVGVFQNRMNLRRQAPFEQGRRGGRRGGRQGPANGQQFGRAGQPRGFRFEIFY